MEAGAAEQLDDTLRRDLDLLFGPGVAAVVLRLDDLGRELPGDLAADRAEHTLELADAGLAGVVGDDRAQRLVGHRDP